MTCKINLHNYVKILYHIPVDLESGTEEFKKQRIQQIYVDRVVTNHYNDDKVKESMISLVDSSVADFIKIYYRNVPIESPNKCCCFK